MKHLTLLRFFAFANLLVVAFLWRYPVICLTGLLVVAFFMLHNFSYISWKKWIIFGIAGALSELFCMYFGAWAYTGVVGFGIPIWLPILWGNACVYVCAEGRK